MRELDEQTSKSDKPSSALSRDIALYALAAGAAGVSVLAFAQSADAEVVYTPVHQAINRHEGFAIDLNNDGIVDFRIHNLFRVVTEGGFPYVRNFTLLVSPADGVQCGKDFQLAAALSSGAKIGPIEPGRDVAFLADQLRTSGLGTYYSGSWLNVSNRYLGLAFHIDGETHYGWARLSVRWNHKWAISAEITGYAYETEPNKPISAGDTGSRSAVDKSSPASEMYSNPMAKERSAFFGALALGAGGLRVWRRTELDVFDIKN